MGEFIYYTLDGLFGSGLDKDLIEWMGTIFETAKKAFGNGDGAIVSSFVDAFAAVACAMLIVYFFMDMTNQASRDMFSFDKLVIGFIKLVLAFALLLCLKDLLRYFCNFGYDLFKWMAEENPSTELAGNNKEAEFKYFGKFTTWPKKYSQDVEDGLAYYIDGFINIIAHTLILLPALAIIWALNLVMRLVGYFFTTSTIVGLIVRGCFSPLAVVQMFEDGTRSSGIRYLKGLLADMITFAVIIVILNAAAYLSNNVMQDIFAQMKKDGVKGLDGTDKESATLGKILKPTYLVKMLIPKLAAIGSIAGSSKLAHDIMGG